MIYQDPTAMRNFWMVLGSKYENIALLHAFRLQFYKEHRHGNGVIDLISKAEIYVTGLEFESRVRPNLNQRLLLGCKTQL